MRQESERKVRVRGKVIGGAQPLICLSLVAKDEDGLYKQAAELVDLQPDLLEWRIDGYQKVTDISQSLSVLREIRMIIGKIPLIFTCRLEREGGVQTISPPRRLALIVEAIQSGDVDIIDIELCNEQAFIERLGKSAKENNVKLILSYHNFIETPDEERIYETLVTAQEKGADIAKLAVMAKEHRDVLVLLGASNRARNGAVKIPMVTISMGPKGQLSRLAGGMFGSDITFAAGRKSSAPGQIQINGLRQGMTLFYRED